MRSYKTINKKKSRKRSRKNFRKKSRKNIKIGGASSLSWCKKSRNKLTALKEIIKPVFDAVKDHETGLLPDGEDIQISIGIFDKITEILGLWNLKQVKIPYGWEGPGHHLFE